MGVEPEDMHTQSEEYEHLGQIEVCVLNLRERYKELTEERRVFISPEEAEIQITSEFSQPPPIVWDWLTDPRKKNLYDPSVTWSTASKARGRTGKGARNHCAHGKDEISVQTILDWRPFDYFTAEFLSHAGRESWMDWLNTYSLEELPEGKGTLVHTYIKFKKLTLITRLAIGTGLFTMIMGKMYQQAMDRMEVMMREAVDQQSSSRESSSAVALASGA
jgi:uncharacterized protein YndB with AHSA1/START domain